MYNTVYKDMGTAVLLDAYTRRGKDEDDIWRGGGGKKKGEKKTRKIKKQKTKH
jgi:hypothetical protein